MRRFASIALVLVVLGAVAACSDEPVRDARPSSSAAATAPARPPTTTQPAPTTSPVVLAQTFSGTGDDVVDLATPIEFGVMTFECSGCSSNVIIETDAEFDNSLVNAIGSYSGMQWLNPRGTVTSRFQVTADSDWTLTAGGLDERVAQYRPGQTVQGTGDTVFILNTPTDTATFAHDGRSNFMVQTLTETSTSGPDLVINEIGNYDGTVLLRTAGAQIALVQVSADGQWTMTPK